MNVEGKKRGFAQKAHQNVALRTTNAAFASSEVLK
jgi:hypothetical protein